MSNATRGYGALENLLAIQRSNFAKRLVRTSSVKKRILDIGCGTTPVFLSQVDFCEKYGLDKTNGKISSNYCGDEINLIGFDIEKDYKLPFTNDYFNAVTMLAVIEHVDPLKISDFLTEIYRVLAPNGICAITTPSSWTSGLLNIMARIKLVSAVEIGEHKKLLTHSQISLLLQKAGFQKADISYGYFEIFMNSWIAAIKK